MGETTSGYPGAIDLKDRPLTWSLASWLIVPLLSNSFCPLFILPRANFYQGTSMASNYSNKIHKVLADLGYACHSPSFPLPFCTQSTYNPHQWEHAAPLSLHLCSVSPKHPRSLHSCLLELIWMSFLNDMALSGTVCNTIHWLLEYKLSDSSYTQPSPESDTEVFNEHFWVHEWLGSIKYSLIKWHQGYLNLKKERTAKVK